MRVRVWLEREKAILELHVIDKDTGRGIALPETHKEQILINRIVGNGSPSVIRNEDS